MLSLTTRGSWARTIFFGRKFHIWEGKDEAFKKVSLPAKEGSYRNKGEENISWVTEFCPALPEGTNSYIIFHTPTQLLQQAEMSGSTSKTEQEPLGRPEVPLQLLFPTAATSAKWQEQQNFTKKLNPGVILFLLFFSPFFFQSICCWRGSSVAPFHRFKMQGEKTWTLLPDEDEPPTLALGPRVSHHERRFGSSPAKIWPEH